MIKKLLFFLFTIFMSVNMMATSVTFTKADFVGQGTANTGSEVTATKDGVTFTYSKGYCADESLRCYAHGSLSITADFTIDKINFTTTGGKTGGLEPEVEVNAASYEVADLASQARFTEILITYTNGSTPVVEKDTFIVSYNNLQSNELMKNDTVEDGQSITLPETTPKTVCIVNGWEFAGWSGKDDNIELSDIISGEFTPTQDTILYAVFKLENGSEEAYTLVEEDLNNWSGDYLIAYSSTIFADGRVGGTDGMGAKSTSVNPKDNLNGNVVNVNWGDLYNITLEAITGGYVMKTKDGKYNYQTNNNNGLSSTNNKTTAEQYPLSITFNSSSDIDISISAGAVFHYNLDGYFRFYKNGGQNNIYMYKRNSTSSYDYDTNPSCESTPTAIETLETKTNAYKIMKNGEIQIHRDNKKYNIFGQRIQ